MALLSFVGPYSLGGVSLVYFYLPLLLGPLISFPYIGNEIKDLKLQFKSEVVTYFYCLFV